MPKFNPKVGVPTRMHRKRGQKLWKRQFMGPDGQLGTIPKGMVGKGGGKKGIKGNLTTEYYNITERDLGRPRKKTPARSGPIKISAKKTAQRRGEGDPRKGNRAHRDL